MIVDSDDGETPSLQLTSHDNEDISDRLVASLHGDQDLSVPNKHRHKYKGSSKKKKKKDRKGSAGMCDM